MLNNTVVPMVILDCWIQYCSAIEYSRIEGSNDSS